MLQLDSILLNSMQLNSIQLNSTTILLNSIPFNSALDVLPLVEFVPESGIAIEEAKRLIQRSSGRSKKMAVEHGDGWHEGVTSSGANTLQLGGTDVHNILS